MGEEKGDVSSQLIPYVISRICTGLNPIPSSSSIPPFLLQLLARKRGGLSLESDTEWIQGLEFFSVFDEYKQEIFEDFVCNLLPEQLVVEVDSVDESGTPQPQTLSREAFLKVTFRFRNGVLRSPQNGAVVRSIRDYAGGN